MKKKSSLLFVISGAIFAFFLLFTIAVACIGRQTVVYSEEVSAKVGFGGINQAVFNAIGESSLWYDFTEYLGLIALGTAALFACIGFYQLAVRKSIWAVDREILLLAIFYVLVMLFYLFFELVVVNYRPVLIDGALEASYPSSHSMLACCIFVTAPLACKHLLKSRFTHLAVTVMCFTFALITVIGRLFSGVHWFTDILGALILSASLILLYIAALTLLEENAAHSHRHSHRR